MLFLFGPLGGRDDAGLLSVQVDSRDLAEGQVVCESGNLVDAEASSGVVEENVARHFERVRDRDRAMAFLPPAAELASEKKRGAAAFERRRRRDRSVRQAGHGHDRLEYRS